MVQSNSARHAKHVANMLLKKQKHFPICASVPFGYVVVCASFGNVLWVEQVHDRLLGLLISGPVDDRRASASELEPATSTET